MKGNRSGVWAAQAGFNQLTFAQRRTDSRTAGVSDASGRFVKRAFDVSIALILLLVLSPLLLVVGLLVHSDGGPVFFSQERVGRGGRRFACYKLRTMVVDAEDRLARLLAENLEVRAEWIATQKLKDDPRVTRIGLWLRRSSIDELPQLLNVLLGDMSLVGPRPVPTIELPYYGPEIAQYIRDRPGITGLWQISGRSNLDYQARIKLNNWYIAHRTFFGDLKILAKTVWIIFVGRGAY